MKLGSLGGHERQTSMTNFNILMLFDMLTQLPNLTMDLDNTKSVLNQTESLMPDDVIDFFRQAFGSEMKSMGKELDTSNRSEPRKVVKFQKEEEEAYPTESRMKQRQSMPPSKN